ncbi:hypothetical protein ACLOJK_030848 [Asimina triloba]
MGRHEGWVQPSGLLPNGLSPYEAASVTRVLNAERWSKAEERIAELIACIQPNQPSEQRRNSVADYVQRLIMKCFSCQDLDCLINVVTNRRKIAVFTFGSVPLKTYLPDGDIDLTAFCEDQNLKDTWAQEVRDILEKEEKSENAEFRVKEVQYIQAEVKIIKCLVENIVVDISFNQLGGLCTLCFLEEVDHLIDQNHLFKRSIILIKAWCYYESRILGAHHGLISTYALETLVLYIFHVFNNSFSGPLEVLYRFLEFFSNFDWENFCVSLRGPVPICSLPDMTAEPPRRDSGEVLLSKLFLEACSSVYAVFPEGQENSGQHFVSKHFNVIDPLRMNNNLGRSVSKGNFFRIRSAFAFGARRLARLLECPEENLIAEVNQFFMNTWERHGSGHRPDAPSPYLSPPQPLNPDPVDAFGKFRNEMDVKRTEIVRLQVGHVTQAEGANTTLGVSSALANHVSCSPENMSRTSNKSAISRTQSHKLQDSRTAHAEKVRKSSQQDYTVHEHGLLGRNHFARTRSSPEFTNLFGETSSQGRHNRVPEPGINQLAASRTDPGSKRKNLSSEISAIQSPRSSTEDPSSVRDCSSHQSLDASVDSNSVVNSYHDDAGLLCSIVEELASVSEMTDMHQEEQDLINMMASSRVPCFDRQVPVPANLGSTHLPLPLSPAVSAGYAESSTAGMVPANIPLIEPPWGSNIQISHCVVSASVSHYLPSIGLTSAPEEIVEPSDRSLALVEISQEDNTGLWHEQNLEPGIGFDADNENFQTSHPDGQQQLIPRASNFSSPRIGNPVGSSTRVHLQKFAKESRGKLREGHVIAHQNQNSSEVDAFTIERNADSRFLPVAPSGSTSSRSKSGSENSWDGTSSTKIYKSAKDKRGRKAAPSVVPSSHGKARGVWRYEGASSDHSSSQADDDNRDWASLPIKGTEMVERSIGPMSVPPHVQNHQLPGYEPKEIGGSDSAITIAPLLVGHGSQRRATDNSGVLPLTFYPTGPPVPFLTMLPVYNFPGKTGNPDGSTSLCDRDGELYNNHISQSDGNLGSAESINQEEIFAGPSSIQSSTPVEPSVEHKADILNSDFASHWQNLQYGRFCQSSRSHGPVLYPSPVMVPPLYLQGHFPWDGPGRPASPNGDLVTQLMSYGPHIVPVTPFQPNSSRPTRAYQRYGEVPRYRSGTGTYLPDPVRYSVSVTCYGFSFLASLSAFCYRATFQSQMSAFSWNNKNICCFVERGSLMDMRCLGSWHGSKVSFRDRQSSSSRNHRGSYGYDRHDHGQRDVNRSMNPKTRTFGHSHSRSQAEKPSSRPGRWAAADSRSDRQWDLHQREPFTSYHTQTQTVLSSDHSVQNSANVAYNMYPLPAVNTDGVSASGPNMPPFVMLCTYDNNVGYGPPAGQLKFGSLGPLHGSSLSEASQVAYGGPSRRIYEQRHCSYQGGSPANSSPDQPSSPQDRQLIVTVGNAGDLTFQISDDLEL